MKAIPDLSNANAVVDEYAAAITNPSTLNVGRSWIEFCLQRHGVISDVRALAFGESHAIWYACLVATRRVREISRLEKRMHKTGANGVTTETTIRRSLSPKYTIQRNSLSAGLLREIVGQS